MDKSASDFDEFEPFARLTALVDTLHVVMKDLVKVKAQLQVSESLRVPDSSNDKHAFSMSPSKLVEFESGFDASSRKYIQELTFPIQKSLYSEVSLERKSLSFYRQHSGDWH